MARTTQGKKSRQHHPTLAQNPFYVHTKKERKKNTLGLLDLRTCVHSEERAGKIDRLMFDMLFSRREENYLQRARRSADKRPLSWRCRPAREGHTCPLWKGRGPGRAGYRGRSSARTPSRTPPPAVSCHEKGERYVSVSCPPSLNLYHSMSIRKACLAMSWNISFLFYQEISYFCGSKKKINK